MVKEKIDSVFLDAVRPLVGVVGAVTLKDNRGREEDHAHSHAHNKHNLPQGNRGVVPVGGGVGGGKI